MTTTCGFEGNADVYGFGIRLGIYAQWTATILTTIMIPQDVSFFCAVNNLLQLALFAALAVQTRSGELHVVEVMITLWLLFGALSSASYGGFKGLTHASGLVRLLTYTIIASYMVWFWFRGIDSMEPTPCRTVAFFGGVSPFGPFRIFNDVASIIGLIICASGIVYWFKKLFSEMLDWGLQGNPGLFHQRHWYVPEPGLLREQELFRIGPDGELVFDHKIEIAYVMISLTIVILSIAGAEYTIQANNVSNMYDPNPGGQLIPLLVGAFGLTQASWGSLRNKLQTRKWRFLGKDVWSNKPAP